MNSIGEVLVRLEKRGEKAFIPYITAGDPSLEKTADVLDFFAENGADIIEVGVPFSDPLADGPVIQRAMERALKSGTTLKGVLKTVEGFKRRHKVPVVLMGYCNPFWAYGIEKFSKDAKTAGVDGVLTVDLPPEEADEFIGLLKREGIVSIFLATPVTDERRLKIIGRYAQGFLYFVSVTGVTGERQALSEDILDKIREVKRRIKLPLALGFGVSSPDIIRQFSSSVDGFVVGSALVKRLEEAGSSGSKKEEFETFFRSLATACHTY